MENVENVTEPPVQDLAAEWGAVLAEEAKTDNRVSVAGSERRGSSSASVAVAPITPVISGKDLRPFVRALGSFLCRLAHVSPMTDAEALDIAEPGAMVLTKWAPKVAEWVPELTLATKLGDFVESRAPEYRAAQLAAKEKKGDDTAPASGVVGPEKF